MLSEELLKKFKLDDISLADKLVAARTLFLHSEFCYISKKEEVILDWLMELADEEFSVEVWETIRYCLNNPNMQNLKDVDIKSSTKELFVEFLIHSLESQLHREPSQKPQSSVSAAQSDCPHECPIIIECAVLVVETNVFLYHLRKNVDKYVKLSSLILKSAAAYRDSSIFVRYVKSVQSFCGESFHKEDSFKVFIENIFMFVIETYCSLKKSTSAIPSTDYCSDIFLRSVDESVICEKIDVKHEVLNVIGQIVFPSSMHKRFKLSLQHLFEKGYIDYGILRVLCQFLTKNVTSSNDQTVVHVCTLLFESFVLNYENDFNTVFKFFVIFCCLLGFEPKVEKQDGSSKTCLLSKISLSNAIHQKVATPVQNFSLLLLEQLLTSLKKTTVVLEETVNEISFKHWMQALVIEVLSSSSTYHLKYSTIHTVIQLSPLIIEPIINKILYQVLLQPKETEDEKKAYRTFFHSIFYMFFKVHRIQNLIRYNLLPTLKQVIGEWRHAKKDMLEVTVSDVIPEGTNFVFGSTIGILSGNICISLLRTFKYLLIQNVVEPMEDGQFDAGHRLFLGVLEDLLVSYLKAVRMSEQSVLEPTCCTFMENLKELRDSLGRLGTALLEHDRCTISLASFLRLCLATGDLQLLLLLYSPWSSKQSALQLTQAVEPISATNLTLLLSFLKPQQWNDIAQQAIDIGDESCREALHSLLLQKLRVLVLFGSNIEHSAKMQSTLCEYLGEALSGIQFLQKDQDISVLVPLLPHDKLLSVAEQLTEQLTLHHNDRISELLKNNVLQENQYFLVAIAWASMQKIGGILSKRKRTYSSEAPKLNHRLLVKEIMSSVAFSDVVSTKKKKKALENFTEIARKVNKTCLQILQCPKSGDGMPIDLTGLSEHLMLLRSLPLPFLPQKSQTVLAVGILAVIIVLNEHSDKTSGETYNGTVGGDTSRKKLSSVNNLCREIFQGLLEGPTPAVLHDIMDIGVLVRILHQDGKCPKTLLQLLFEGCTEKPELLENLCEAVCLADDQMEKNVDPSISLISSLLLEMLKKKNISNMPEDVRAVYKKNIHFLIASISQRIISRMKSEKMTNTDVVALLDAFCSVLSSHSKEVVNLVPYVETFLSAAFSVLENADAPEDAKLTVEFLMENVMHNSMKMGRKICGQLMWKTYKSSNRPHLVAKLLKNAPRDDFDRVLKDLCDSLKSGNEHSEMFPDLRLPKSIVTITMPGPKVEKMVEKMIVMASTIAFKKIMQGSYQNKILEFVDFLLAVVLRTKVPLASELADIILTSVMSALEVTSMTLEYVLNVGNVVVRILNMMVLHQFPLLEDRIPAFLQAYHLLVHSVVMNSAVDMHRGSEETEKLEKCALRIEQLSQAVAERSKDFRAVSQYMVADLLREFEHTTIHQRVKVHIMNSLYAFLSLCDTFAIRHLTFALPPASLELFKTALSSYKKFYRYSGKV